MSVHGTGQARQNPYACLKARGCHGKIQTGQNKPAKNLLIRHSLALPCHWPQSGQPRGLALGSHDQTPKPGKARRGAALATRRTALQFCGPRLQK
jgi:hypothetical protein